MFEVGSAVELISYSRLDNSDTSPSMSYTNPRHIIRFDNSSIVTTLSVSVYGALIEWVACVQRYVQSCLYWVLSCDGCQ